MRNVGKRTMYKFLFWLATFALAFNAYRPWAANISVADALYLLSLITFLITALANRQTRARLNLAHPFWFPSLLILLGGLIASFRSEFQLISIRVSVTQFYIFTLWLALGVWVSYTGGMEQTVTALIAGSTTSSLFAIVDFTFGTRTGWWFVTTPNLLDKSFWYRTGGTLGNPNELALYSAVVAPLVLDRILHQPSQVKTSLLKTFLYGLCLLIILSGLVFSGSMTGMIGVAISSLIILLFYFSNRSSPQETRSLWVRGALLLSVFTAGIFIAASLWPDYIEAASTNLRHQNTLLRASSTSLWTRTAFLQRGFDLLGENPLWGYGMDQTGTGGLSREAAQYLTDLYIHNTIIQMWFGGGVLALAGALLLYWRCFCIARQAIVNYLQGISPPYVLGLAASTLSWILMDQVQANIYQRFKWLVVALLIGLLRKSQLPQGVSRAANTSAAETSPAHLADYFSSQDEHDCEGR